ncbi:MAG TPA: DMT family transporter [Hyphomicrobiales bacterium]|nr:DMT family transporter [Hyphomicrobiales bacterium]
MASIDMPPTAPALQIEPLQGIALKILSALVFTVMMAMIKYVSSRVPTGEVMFARSFFGMMPIVFVMLSRGEMRRALKTENPTGHVFRGLVGVSSMFCSFLALGYLPLPDATAIGYAAPLVTVVLSALILQETIRIYRWTAVIVGFAGVLLMLSPHLGAASAGSGSALGAGFALAGAVLAAGAMITVRHLTRTETTSAIVFYFSATASVLALATLPFGWVVPSFSDALVLVGIGLVGGIGQIFLTQSYRYADASTVAPFEYTTMLWSLAIGYMVFGDMPGIEILVGAAIVIAAGIFVILRERALRIESEKARAARTPA